MIKAIIDKFSYTVKLLRHKNAWRRMNEHNFTIAVNFFPLDKVSVGDKTYGPLQVLSYGNETEYLKIGSFCSIAGSVKFLLGGNHSYYCLSTYPFHKYFCHDKETALTKGPIIIHDDVWIGENSLILSGVIIGKGAVIAAGSVVTKDVPPYGIFIKGEVKKYRFDKAVIEKLVNFNFSILTEKVVQRNIDNIVELWFRLYCLFDIEAA